MMEMETEGERESHSLSVLIYATFAALSFTMVHTSPGAEEPLY